MVLFLISIYKVDKYYDTDSALSQKWKNILVGSTIVSMASLITGSVLTEGYTT